MREDAAYTRHAEQQGLKKTNLRTRVITCGEGLCLKSSVSGRQCEVARRRVIVPVKSDATSIINTAPATQKHRCEVMCQDSTLFATGSCFVCLFCCLCLFVRDISLPLVYSLSLQSCRSCIALCILSVLNTVTLF